MYYFLSILSGLDVAIMIVFNGMLGGQLGDFLSAIFIHLTGLIAMTIIVILTKSRIKSKKKLPLYSYSGGVIGLGALIFNVYSFRYLSVTAILALGLFGQVITSSVLDAKGVFGHKKQQGMPALIGMLSIFIGILIMLYKMEFHPLSVILSILAGTTLVLSRNVNAELAQNTSALGSTLFNYITGFCFSIITVLLIGRKDLSNLSKLPTIPFWMFCGGLLGIITVLITLVVAPKISALILSLLIFVGQVFSGIAIDCFLEGSFDSKQFFGSLFVLGGLMVMSILKEKKEKSVLIPS